MEVTNYERLYSEIYKIAKTNVPLSYEKEQENIRLYQKTGDTIYRDKIVVSNLRMIIGIVKKFHYAKKMNPSLFDDMVAIGFQEATECIDKYKLDMGKGTACSFIRNSVERAISNFAKENIENGEFLMLRKFSNRFLEQNLEDIGASYFAHHNHRPPVQGEICEFLHQGKKRRVKYCAKNRPIIRSGNIKIDVEGNEFFDNVDIADVVSEDNTNAFVILSDYIKGLSPRNKEIYDFLYKENKSKSDTLFEISPIDGTEMERIRKTGSNMFEVKVNGKTYNLNFVSHRRFVKDNLKSYSDENIAFNYNSKNKNTFIINTNTKILNILSEIKLKCGTDIYREGQRVDPCKLQALKLKEGKAMVSAKFDQLVDDFILNIRKNKTLMEQLYENK